jgi:hypothetical protein
MGATKTDLFTKQQNDIAGMAKAIAHPARVAILQYVVKNAGIIQGTVEGTSVCYCINPKVWKQYK